MTNKYSAKSIKAVFPFLVQRKNPATGRWINISRQATKGQADIVAVGTAACGHTVRVI